MQEYLFIIYLAAPAFLANMLPVIGAKLNWLNSLGWPLDGNREFRGKPFLGKNKTFRGFVLAALGGMLIGLVQFWLDQLGILRIDFLDSFFSFLAFGFLGGLGAIVGDAFKSFFKRQMGIKSGRPFFPFDQIDYILGFLVFTWPFISWTINEIIFLLVFVMVLNPVVNTSAYFLRIKKTYW